MFSREDIVKRFLDTYGLDLVGIMHVEFPDDEQTDCAVITTYTGGQLYTAYIWIDEKGKWIERYTEI